jgi:hypothetical protein
MLPFSWHQPASRAVDLHVTITVFSAPFNSRIPQTIPCYESSGDSSEG